MAIPDTHSFLDRILEHKRFEVARFHSHITDWETNEYLELY